MSIAIIIYLYFYLVISIFKQIINGIVFVKKDKSFICILLNFSLFVKLFKRYFN